MPKDQSFTVFPNSIYTSTSSQLKLHNPGGVMTTKKYAGYP